MNRKQELEQRKQKLERAIHNMKWRLNQRGSNFLSPSVFYDADELPRVHQTLDQWQRELFNLDEDLRYIEQHEQERERDAKRERERKAKADIKAKTQTPEEPKPSKPAAKAKPQSPAEPEPSKPVAKAKPQSPAVDKPYMNSGLLSFILEWRKERQADIDRMNAEADKADEAKTRHDQQQEPRQRRPAAISKNYDKAEPQRKESEPKSEPRQPQQKNGRKPPPAEAARRGRAKAKLVRKRKKHKRNYHKNPKFYQYQIDRIDQKLKEFDEVSKQL